MDPETLTVVVIVLGLVVAVLAIVVLALARQIGILHTRLAPAGALMNTAGPEIGQPAPQLSVATIDGSTLAIGGPGAQPVLLLFVSPSCPVCKELVPVARSLAPNARNCVSYSPVTAAIRRSTGTTSSAWASAPTPTWFRRNWACALPRTNCPTRPSIDRDGTLRSRGLVNSREHLESLVEAMLSGFDSIQDYLVQERQLEQAS
jgi:hypothetical protein